MTDIDPAYAAGLASDGLVRFVDSTGDAWLIPLKDEDGGVDGVRNIFDLADAADRARRHRGPGGVMSDRIDHAAKAGEALNAAHETPAEGQVADPWLLAAQAHATLALVEQQRLANLIALAQYAGEYVGADLLRAEAVNALVTWVPHAPDDGHPEIRPDVAAALGIGVRDA